MKQRQCPPIDVESSTGGTTWLELFILFDVIGARSSNGDHVKDIEAAKRAKARSTNQKKQEGKRKAQIASVKPSMGEDIGRFKARAHHIARHEVDKEQAGWVEMEKRQYHRRRQPWDPRAPTRVGRSRQDHRRRKGEGHQSDNAAKGWPQSKYQRTTT